MVIFHTIGIRVRVAISRPSEPTVLAAPLRRHRDRQGGRVAVSAAGHGCELEGRPIAEDVVRCERDGGEVPDARLVPGGVNGVTRVLRQGDLRGGYLLAMLLAAETLAKTSK